MPDRQLAWDRATEDRLRDRGICPRCDQQFTDKGAMESIRAMVQLHEALTCRG